MEIFLLVKNLWLKTARKTINKPVVNRKSPRFYQWTSVTPAPGWEKLITWDRGKMCQAGPIWRPNSEIAWNTERFLLHVRYTNSTCSPSSNANIFWSISFQFLTVYLFLIILFFSRNYCMHDPTCNADLLFVSNNIHEKISRLWLAERNAVFW